MKKTFSFILLLALLASASGCGEKPAAAVQSTEASASDSAAVPEESAPEYAYPEADYNEYEFKFLNVEHQSWANALIAPEETTGDMINDALFERNARIEERFNITIKEIDLPMDDVAPAIRQNVSAGDDAYDVCMLPIHRASGIINDKIVLDLKTVEALKLDEPWWDQTVNKSAELFGHIYMTTSDISFFPFEASWGVFFNEDLFDDLSLDYPYQLVRDGKWTLDKLTEFAKAGAQLNQDEGFTQKTWESGSSVRGFCSHHGFPIVAIFGSGEKLAEINGDTPEFLADKEKMFNLYSKIQALTSDIGAYWNFDFSSTTSILQNFMNNRLLMCSETLGYLTTLREMSGNFGVLPVPKYDESQDSYHSMIATWGTAMTTIPITSGNPERTGIILDALAYDSYVNLMEPYYETYLTQKGVRNEDSAEMLRIIRESRGIVTDLMFGWTTKLEEAIKVKLKLGEPVLASVIEAQRSSVLNLMQNSIDSMK